jgi:hypothetical protein
MNEAISVKLTLYSFNLLTFRFRSMNMAVRML